jgi:ADP-heptose:LPS heptosyltransferase
LAARAACAFPAWQENGRLVAISRTGDSEPLAGWNVHVGCGGSAIRLVGAMLRSLLVERPTIVVLGDPSLLPFALLVRCIVPVAVTALLIDGEIEESAIRHTCQSWIFRSTIDNAICASQDAASLISGCLGALTNDIRIVAAELDTGTPAAASRDHEARDPRHLLAVARLDRADGVGALVPAIARLHRSIPDIRCDVVGEGALVPGLVAFARALGVEERLRFVGRPTGAVLAELYGRAGLLVLPKLAGSGRAMRQAWRQRIPVLCDDHPHAAFSITDGIDGMVVDTAKVDQLCAGIERAIVDRDLRARLTDGGIASLRAQNTGPSADPALADAFDVLALLAHEHMPPPRHARHAADGAGMRVLVYRLGSIGDMVVSLPSLHAIRRRYPTAEIALLTNQPSEQKAAAAGSILQGTGVIDRFISYPLSTRHIVQLRAVRSAIRAFRPDMLFYLAAPRGTLNLYRDLLFFKLSGISACVGFPMGADLRECRAPSAPGGGWEREAFRLARCLGQFGPDRPDRLKEWDLGLSPAEIAEANRIVARWLANAGSGLRLIGVCVGTKQPIKDWGEDNWRTVLRALRNPAYALVMIGAEDEWERSETVAEGWPAPVLNFCGHLTPRLSAAVIRSTELFLCHDSGPMHLAAAQGVRCIAIFSRQAPPGQWFPIGDQHTVFYPPSPDDTIAAIQPAQVIEAATAALRQIASAAAETQAAT